MELGLSRLVASLTGLLEETDVQLYLAGVVILGKVNPASSYKAYLKLVLTLISQRRTSDLKPPPPQQCRLEDALLYLCHP